MIRSRFNLLYRSSRCNIRPHIQRIMSDTVGLKRSFDDAFAGEDQSDETAKRIKLSNDVIVESTDSNGLVNGDSNQFSQNTDSNQPPTQSDSLTSSKKSLPFRKRYLAGPDQDHTTNDSTAPQDAIISESSAFSLDRSTSGFDEPLIRKARLDNLERESPALDLDRSSEESSADDEDDDFQVGGNKPAKFEEEDGEDEDDNYSDEKLYCICRQPYNEEKFMICCDSCDEWYHGDCVGISAQQGRRLPHYVCPSCMEKKEKERQEREEIERELERIRSLKSDNKCLNNNCREFARKGSKFCSHECGITHAMEMIQQKEREDEANRKREIETKKLKEHEELVNAIKQQQEQARLQQETLTAQSITTFTVADKEDMKLLEEIEKERADIKERQAELVKKKAKLDDIIERSKSNIVDNSPAKGDKKEKKDKERRHQNLDVMDCVTCGQPIPASNFSHHLEKCYSKTDAHNPWYGSQPTTSEDGSSIVYCDYFDPKTKLYCKKLRASCALHSVFTKAPKISGQVCGCPTDEFTSGHCERLRKNCVKHTNWESLRKAELLLEEISYEQAMKALMFEEKEICNRINRRRKINESSANATQVIHEKP